MEHAILVPLDGSIFSEQALPLAALIARRAGVKLRLAHVHVPHPPYSLAVEGMALIDEGQIVAAARKQERAYLLEVRDRLVAEGDLHVSFVNLEGGVSVAGAIAHEAEMSHCDLVVMTTHGRGGLARFWMGSVADALVRRLNVPLLLLRPHEGTPPAGLPLCKQILLPLDGSALAEQMLEPALALGTLMQAEYTLLKVIELFRVVGSTSFTYSVNPAHVVQQRVESQAYLDSVAQRLRDSGCVVHTRVAVAEQTAPAILEEARRHGIDLIAVATHGRSGMTRLLLGSVADKVVRGADTPVLVYRPQGA